MDNFSYQCFYKCWRNFIVVCGLQRDIFTNLLMVTW